MRKLLACVALVGFLCAGAASETAGFWRDPRRLLLLGTERLAQEDYREAVPLLEASLRLAPESKAARAWLAHAFHLQRRLDEAAAHYARLLKADPVREPEAATRETILRFAPRVFQTPSDPFGLLDAVAIHHPEEPVIAYHFFWEDDIDFPSDNDPCDHELVWVRYDPAGKKLVEFSTYFHGRILISDAAVRESSQHASRARVNVQWGKHGSLPHGWEDLQIQAHTGDIERRHLDLQRPQTLREYNSATYQKLRKEGRQFADHPRTSGWPVRFEGSWDDFVRFEKEIDIRPRLKMAVSRWNNAALQQNLLAYNFRPKTEWPDRAGAVQLLEPQLDHRVGANSEAIMSPEEARALRERAGAHPDPFLGRLAGKPPGLPFDLPAMSLFRPETPRYPNVWFYARAEEFDDYRACIRFLEGKLRQSGYASVEVELNEGADAAFSVEHLQPWDAVTGLRHAHALHARLFWKRLEARSLHVVNSAAGNFWRIAGSFHYEVEHAHPLHADVEVCPLCGRTGGYASMTGNLVELVHDPLGVELLLWGMIRGEQVRRTDGSKLDGLVELLRVEEKDLFLTRPYRADMNTAALAVLLLHAKQ